MTLNHFVVAHGCSSSVLCAGTASSTTAALSPQQQQPQHQHQPAPSALSWRLSTGSEPRCSRKLTFSLSKHAAASASTRRLGDRQQPRRQRVAPAVASLTVTQSSTWAAADGAACCSGGGSGSPSRRWWSPLSSPRQQQQHDLQSNDTKCSGASPRQHFALEEQQQKHQQQQQQRQQHAPPPAAAANLTTTAMALDSLGHAGGGGNAKPLHVAILDHLEHGKLLVAGAMSAVVSRTAVAPLERVGWMRRGGLACPVVWVGVCTARCAALWLCVIPPPSQLPPSPRR